jgi:arylsulfatase A-like enzyme
MPNYFALARSGVVFADHHAVYPTFTMMNSASIATGTYPGVHGFYGNVVYAPNAIGKNAKGVDIDFSAPAFIDDFGVVEAVRESYHGKLTLVATLLQAAQAKGLSTAAIGKFGAAFIQDYKQGASSSTKMRRCHSLLPGNSSRRVWPFRGTQSTPTTRVC